MKYKKSSFLDDFELPEVTHSTIKSCLAKISNSHREITKSSTNYNKLPLTEKLALIKNDVYTVLGRYKSFIKVIYDINDFHEYITKAIDVGYIALDTETNNSLDPLTCKIMGLCLYIPNTRPVYVPINHIDINTGIRLVNQISESDAAKELRRLIDAGTKIIYHNGKFDIRVIYNTLGLYMPIWWDTMLAAQLLNENEKAGLKFQYKYHINPTISSYNIEKLFMSIPYEKIDPELFGIYAAIDAYDTYKLQQYQYREFNKPGMSNMFKLFLDIEVPVTLVVAHMEDTGISMNLDYVKRLEIKYTAALDEAINKLNKILEPHHGEISVQQQLGNLDSPLNFNSSTQLQIIMYDILKIEPPISGNKATDKDTLVLIDNDFTKALLEYRHYSKALTAFIKPLPELLSKKDNKIHAKFNQMGAEDNNVRTGRFSSTGPNLQQIPSKGDGKEMRLMFCGSTEYNNREVDNNKVLIKSCEEVETLRGWLFPKDLSVGDTIISDDDRFNVLNIEFNNLNDTYILDVFSEALV